VAGSLRDALSDAYDKATEEEQVQQPAVGEQKDVTPEAAAETAAPEQEKPGRTAGRARDEHGRLLPGKAVRPETPAAEGQPTAPSTTAQAQTPPAAELKPLQRPSSWKKEMWPLWDKLTKGEPLTPQEARQKAEYILQREGDFAKGVSTYKQEWERAKPMLDAVAPYLPLYQQHGIDPAQQFAKYAEIHKGLALGTPEQKLGMLLRIAQDYQIPVQNMFVRGQDGQVYFNQQLMQQAQQAPQQRAPQPDIRKTVQELLAEERAVQEAAAMESDTEKYPHFAEVKQSMAGLLQAGLAQDLPSAYEAALRLPNHFHLFEAQQQQQRQKEEQERLEAQRKSVEAARRNQVSPRTSSPAGKAQGGSTKGLRSQLEAAFDEHTTGRV
jgi:hypothetical protein